MLNDWWLSVTEDQEYMWAMLKCEPQKLCHTWADQLMVCKSDENAMNALADDFVYYMLDRFSHTNTCRVIKTWLTVYKLPIEPGRLTSFDQFHVNCGQFVVNNPEIIDVFEKV
jgi:hypothetical protein